MWIVDKKQLIKWIIASTARGLAFVLVSWLGMSAASSQETAGQIASGAGAVVVAIISIVTSVKGRKKILAETPPEKK